jgi:hypothetical protein
VLAGEDVAVLGERVDEGAVLEETVGAAPAFVAARR